MKRKVPVFGCVGTELGRNAISRGWQAVDIGPSLHGGSQGKLRWLGDSQCTWISHSSGNDGLLGEHSWTDMVRGEAFAVQYLPIYGRGEYYIADISFAYPMASREGDEGDVNQ